MQLYVAHFFGILACYFSMKYLAQNSAWAILFIFFVFVQLVEVKLLKIQKARGKE